MPDPKEQQKQWEKIVAKAWADEDFKQRLLDDPTAVLKAAGVKISEGVDLKCVEDTDKIKWLVLPKQPTTSIEEGEERLAATGFTLF